MKYKVITAAFDITQTPPQPIEFIGSNRIGKFLGTETIDTVENVLFAQCKNVHDVEDVVLAFWNRLNESSIEAPHYTGVPTSKVVVVHVYPLGEKS